MLFSYNDFVYYSPHCFNRQTTGFLTVWGKEMKINEQVGLSACRICCSNKFNPDTNLICNSHYTFAVFPSWCPACAKQIHQDEILIMSSNLNEGAWVHYKCANEPVQPNDDKKLRCLKCLQQLYDFQTTMPATMFDRKGYIHIKCPKSDDATNFQKNIQHYDSMRLEAEELQPIKQQLFNIRHDFKDKFEFNFDD